MRIGIDLGGTNVRMGLIENGIITKKIAEPCKSGESEEAVLNHLVAMLRSVITGKVTNIGIGVPSVVDSEKGIVYNVMNIPSWKEVHLKDFLEAEFKIPVSVNNDCNCFALGEFHFGEGTPYEDVVCIALGTGVGSGIIIDNKLYSGKNTGAGEIGSLPYLDADYESYCSSHFFAREYGITGKAAFERASQGDAEALNIWGVLGNHVGNLIQVALFAYDPQAIVLGGSISNAFNLFSEAMYTNLKSFIYPNIVEKLKIHVSQKEDISILGAAML